MLNYVALGLLIFVFVFVFYAIIIVHDIPYERAKKRLHSHQDAIHVAGWVSLLTQHIIRPFLWIWATLYRPDRGWGMGSNRVVDQVAPGLAQPAGAPADDREPVLVARLETQIDRLNQRIAGLEARVGDAQREKTEPSR